MSLEAGESFLKEISVIGLFSPFNSHLRRRRSKYEAPEPALGTRPQKILSSLSYHLRLAQIAVNTRRWTGLLTQQGEDLCSVFSFEH